MAIPATATTPTTTPAAMPATLVLDPLLELAPEEGSGASVCCWLDGMVTTTVVPGAMLVETAALSVVGAGVVDDDGDPVADADADAEEELELEPL